MSGKLWIVIDRWTKEAVGIMHQTPFSDMSALELAECSEISEFLIEERKACYCVPTDGNRSHPKGKMNAFGWRKAMVGGEIVGKHPKYNNSFFILSFL